MILSWPKVNYQGFKTHEPKRRGSGSTNLTFGNSLALYPRHTCSDLWVHPLLISFGFVLTSPWGRSVFRPGCLLQKSCGGTSKKGIARLSWNQLQQWSFLYFFFFQCYSCLNKHWLLMMQVAGFIPCCVL